MRHGAKQTLRWPGDRDPRDHVIKDPEWERFGSLILPAKRRPSLPHAYRFVTRLTDVY
jgi:hypothetical protein